jgi:hypothetical protein
MKEKDINVALIIPYYINEVTGRFARFHDIIQYLNSMKKPPFKYRVISLNQKPDSSKLFFSIFIYKIVFVDK